MSLSDNLSLDSDALHVWDAALDLDEPSTAAFRRLLDSEETARADRFHFERDRRHFTVARGILRSLLARYLSTSAIRFGYSPRGKPFVSSPETSLRFNLSHSDGHALFVFAHNREVGIDLEAGARLKDDWPSLARRVFSTREQAELNSLPPGLRRAAFLNGWTRKEAYLKATGLGIADGLQRIEITLDPRHPPKLLATPTDMDWTIHDLHVPGGPAAACVAAGRAAPLITRFAWPP